MKIQRIILIILAVLLCVPLVSCVAKPAGEAPAGEPTADTSLKPYQATEEEMKAATAAVEARQLLRGMWVTPRLKANQDQEVFDAEYKKVKEAGINVVYTYDELSSEKLMKKVLEACDKNGIKVMISLNRIKTEASIKTNVKYVRKYDEYPCVIGYNMYDEPNSSMFELLGKQYDAIREACAPDKIIMINFFPNYASKKQLGVSDSENPYREYLEMYYEAAKSDLVSFDYYPYRTDSDQDIKNYAGLISDLCEIMKVANARNLPASGFVQSGEWSGTRTPKLGELRLLSHVHLLFGLKYFNYFLYVTPINGVTEEGTFLGLVEYDGTIRDTYYKVQQTTAELDGMKGVYLDYDFKGVIMSSAPQEWKDALINEFDIESFAPVKEIKAGNTKEGIISGCFEKKTGEKGVYAVNCDPYYGQSATITFTGLTEYRVWGANGIEQMGAANEIEIRFAEGEGKFVEIIG